MKGYEQVIKNFKQIVEGFNNKKWDLIEPVTDDNVTLTRFEKSAKTHKKGKANYKKHLEDDAWKRNGNWNNVVCETPVDVKSLVKLVVTYDFTWTNLQNNETMSPGPAFAVMFFNKGDNKLTDFTVGSLPRQ